MFEMSTVIGRYNDYLNEQQMSLNSYTIQTQRLKLRLNKHFGDTIVFHQPYDRTKSELLYSTAISLQDVINSAHKCNAAAIERVSCEQPSFEMADCDRVNLLYHAAQLIKSEITDASVPQWRTSSMAHSSMPQFRCGAVLVCRSFARMSVWRMHFVYIIMYSSIICKQRAQRLCQRSMYYRSHCKTLGPI